MCFFPNMEHMSHSLTWESIIMWQNEFYPVQWLLSNLKTFIFRIVLFVYLFFVSMLIQMYFYWPLTPDFHTNIHPM